MHYSIALSMGLALLGPQLVNAGSVAKRFSNGDFATGETDPNVSAACTYWANSILPTDTCADLQRFYGITIAQLVSWNPSLSSASCTLNEGWSYCVESTDPVKPTTTSSVSKTTTTITTTTKSTRSTTTSTTTSASVPSPTQAGLISTCNAYYFVKKGDYCQAIVDSFHKFTLTQFYHWNPAVGNDCSGLQAGYYVCVGVTGSTGSTTTTATTRTTKETTTAVPTTTNPYEPHQSGMISTCNAYCFVEPGDTCAEIAKENGIPLSKFYTWNPAVGNSCSGLQAGYYVCVGIAGEKTTTTTNASKTTTTTKPVTTTAGTAPSPTQSGIAADCTKYYKAASGDSCWSITNQKYAYLAGTNLFYDWNPAVGSSCSNFQAGYYYCVATERHSPMPDTISTCTKWHLVVNGDSCWSIEQKYSISAAKFTRWNPYVGSDCTALWKGYFVCVGAED